MSNPIVNVFTSNNKDLNKVIVNRINELGYKWPSPVNWQYCITTAYGYSIWDDGHVMLTGDKLGSLCGLRVDIDELFTDKYKFIPKKQSIIVKLNDNCDAVVDERGITVGGQTFSQSKVEELYCAIKKYNT